MTLLCLFWVSVGNRGCSHHHQEVAVDSDTAPGSASRRCAVQSQSWHCVMFRDAPLGVVKKVYSSCLAS